MEEPKYWKLRYRFDDNIELTEDSIKKLLQGLIVNCFKKEELLEGILGIHLTNSNGLPEHPHFHLHFLSHIKDKTFRDRFKKWRDSIGDTRKGNKLYGFQCITEDELKDIDKFYRYPLKESNQFDTLVDTINGSDFRPKLFDYCFQKQLAREQRNVIVESNQKHLASKDKEKTFDKLEKHLKAMDVKTLDDIKRQTIEFYKINKLACNFATMKGYINTYRLLHGFMSTEEAMTYL